MTILNCSAVTCIYNKDQLCSRGEIEVMGMMPGFLMKPAAEVSVTGTAPQ